MTGPYSGRTRLMLLDVDGVLTDGSLHMDATGESHKTFNVRDGVAVGLLKAHGIQTGVLSGKASAPLDYRIRELGIEIAVTGNLNKPQGLVAVLEQTGLAADEVAYVGDEIVDLQLAGRVGRFYAPADAHPLVLARADHVLLARGGQGAVREAAEHLLTSAGLTLEAAYAPLIDHWEERHVVQ